MLQLKTKLDKQKAELTFKPSLEILGIDIDNLKLFLRKFERLLANTSVK